MTESNWSRELLESDRRYFEAGADVLPIPAAVIAVLPGAERLAAGCVVQRIDTSLVAADAGTALGPGDVVFFHGLTPHRSASNRGTSPRRGFFVTYVPSRYPELEARYVTERIDLPR